MMNRISPSLLLVAAAMGANAQSVTLKLNLQAGKTYRIESTTKTSMNMGQGENGMGTTQTTALKVLAKTATGFKVKSTIEAVKATGTGMMAQSASGIESGMKGKSFDSDVDFRGRSTGKTASAMGGGMSNLSNMTTSVTGAEFPATPVKVGSTWTTSIDLAKAMGGNAQGMKIGGSPIVTKYTVKSISSVGGKTLVMVTTSVSGKPTMSMAGGGQGQAMNMAMSISGSGTATIDASTGLVTQSKMTMLNSTAVGSMNMKQTVTVSTRLK